MRLSKCYLTLQAPLDASSRNLDNTFLSTMCNVRRFTQAGDDGDDDVREEKEKKTKKGHLLRLLL